MWSANWATSTPVFSFYTRCLYVLHSLGFAVECDSDHPGVVFPFGISFAFQVSPMVDAYDHCHRMTA